MDKSRPAAERVRPILQAMERSIDAARRRRLHRDETPADEPAVVPSDPRTALRLGEPGARLKARPKRSTAFGGSDDGPHLHSQAG